MKFPVNVTHQKRCPVCKKPGPGTDPPDTPHDTRVIAKSTDPMLVTRATTEELIGTSFEVTGNTLIAG